MGFIDDHILTLMTFLPLLGGAIVLRSKNGFDDPGTARQSLAANSSATADARNRAEKFFALNLAAQGGSR